jgi:mannose-1-phosphate guanylyltransferase
MNTEERPWGNYRVIHREPGIQVKRIEVKPGLRFSLQKHQKRSERWIVLSGKGVATLGERQISVEPGAFLEVPCGEVHRMQNTGLRPLAFVEVQFGDYLGEDDIVRLHDDFGR